MKNFSGIITEQFKYSDNIINALKEVGLGVYEITDSTWMGKWGKGDTENMLLLEDEKSMKEFRVYLGEYFTEKNVDDNWNFTTREKYIEEYGEDDADMKSFEEDLDKVGKLQKIDKHSDTLEFSVFLPSNVKFHDKNSPKYDIFVAGCLTQATVYFRILKETISETYKNPILNIEHCVPITDDPKLFGVFLKLHNIQITNYNMDIAYDALYRLYKDSKFFYNLKEFIGDDKYKWLIDELSKV